jgi:hypothetical protein
VRYIAFGLSTGETRPSFAASLQDILKKKFFGGVISRVDTRLFSFFSGGTPSHCIPIEEVLGSLPANPIRTTTVFFCHRKTHQLSQRELV